MLQPSVVVDAVTALVRSIGAYVDAMGMDATAIQAHHDMPFDQSALSRRVANLSQPGTIIAYRGFGPGKMEAAEVWLHRVSIFVRGPEGKDSADLPWMIVNGIPSRIGAQFNATLKFLFAQPLMFLERADTPACDRKQDANGIDYFELQLTYREIGDN